MNDVRMSLLEPNPSSGFPLATTSPTPGSSPSIAERWLVPLMWLAIGVVTSVTTPLPVADPPLLQTVVGEVLGWAALLAIVGLVAAAVAARSSLPLWSYGLGAVGLIGLATCQMFGHPVFSSTWGLSQVALVSAGMAITGRMSRGPSI